MDVPVKALAMLHVWSRRVPHSGLFNEQPTIALAPSRRPAGRDRRIAYLPCLDGLRALAVILVLAAHFPPITGAPASFGMWSVAQSLRTGALGVDLFFALSGFLITRILLRQRLMRGGFSLRVFYARRALRILPIYYLTVVACILYFGTAWPQTLGALTYTINYILPFHPEPFVLEHSWSLAVEEQFYLVWPLVLARVPLHWLPRLTGLVVPLAALAASLLFAMLTDGPIGSQLVYMSTPSRIITLSLGAYLAVREQRQSPMRSLECVCLLVGGVGGLVLAVALRRFGVLVPGGPYWCAITLASGMAASGCVAALVFGRDDAVGLLRAVLSVRPLRYIGAISYGLYLYHLPILYALRINPAAVDWHGAPAPLALLAVVLTGLVAVLSFHLIERPLLRLKNRLRRAPDGSMGLGIERGGGGLIGP